MPSAQRNFPLSQTRLSTAVVLGVQNMRASAQEERDTGLTPGLGRSPGEGHGNPLQYSCLENPLDRGAWWVTVHGVTKSWTRLSNLAQHRLKKKAAIWSNKWMNLEDNMLSEITTEKQIAYDLAYM